MSGGTDARGDLGAVATAQVIALPQHRRSPNREELYNTRRLVTHRQALRAEPPETTVRNRRRGRGVRLRCTAECYGQENGWVTSQAKKAGLHSEPGFTTFQQIN